MAEFLKMPISKLLPLNLKSVDSNNPNLSPEATFLQNNPDFNKLIFPNNPNQVYKFDSKLFKTDFTELCILGASKYAVKSFKHSPSSNILAIKFLPIPHNRHGTDEDQSRRLLELVREIKNIRSLSHVPNVVNCYGVCLYENQALICMEQMDLSLKEVYVKVHEQNGTFPEEFLACIVIAMLNALIACKAQQVIHRDIKPDNVLLRRNGEIKLSDFGEARILEDSLASTFTGTLCYWPPERFEVENEATENSQIEDQQKNEATENDQIEGQQVENQTTQSTTSTNKKYDVRADIWSLGIVLIEIATGSVPYKDRKGNVPNNIILLQNLILNLDSNKVVEEAFPVGSFSDETREFIRLCLNKVKSRPKYDGLKQTRFYQKYGSISYQNQNNIVEKWLQSYKL
uniref:mitogen-activated protein kinase kinase n=1 Tax=Acrobeloides nanus TaxID=290746 RepID=A0A914CKK0_9BILA